MNDLPDELETNDEETRQSDHKEHLMIAGIGASAGGLVALGGFFDALPDDPGVAFVVVTHMHPERESLLPELLQKHTGMPVRQVRDNTAVEANHVYVISPGRRILITDTHLNTEEFEEPRGHRVPIDHFFRSLAEVHREAIAVILSGGGTDGAVGVKAVKENGGLLLVQHPDEAEYDSMPRAAIATGLADVVLPVADLAQKLVAYARNGVRLTPDPRQLTAEELETLYRILTQVQVQTGHDFSQYKRSTILRRIQRRMQLYGLATLDAYLEVLRQNSGEAHALFNDLLIGVTNFFRDKEAWDALAKQVIPDLFEDKGPGDSVRVWTLGCATGEEAYSVAILLMEYVGLLGLPTTARPTLHVFASDLDENALAKAREGLYPEAIEADVSMERLARYFSKEGSYYRVNRELRDIVLFANHSVLRDPPFSRLDLISCRNLLIYLNPDMQENVFQIFHYALSPEGYLFLGSAESADAVNEAFRTLDKTHRIYQARARHERHPRLPTLPLTVRRLTGREAQLPLANQQRPAYAETPNITATLHLELLERSAPANVLVDETYHVIHLSPLAGRYLQHPAGTVTNDLLKLVRVELQFELRTALFHAFEQNKKVVSRPVYVRFNGTARRVVIAVSPRVSVIDNDTNETSEADKKNELDRLALIFFLEHEAGDKDHENRQAPPEGEEREGYIQREALMAQLEGEVQHLRERLQATTEEYESSNEELKAANEELQSINEEYRSTTEELETSKEELQSVNEELQTVNTELKSKLDEISRAHSDLENLMVATDLATLFLDRELQIQRFTPRTAELFNIMPSDRGRPISHLTNRLDYEKLEEDAKNVLRKLVPIEREVQGSEGRWLLVRLRPYRTVDDRIDGVVLTFIEVTDLKESERNLRAAKDYGEKVVDTVREGLLVLKPDLTVEFANESFYEIFRVTEQATIGSLVYDLGNGQWDIPELRQLLEEVLPEHNIFNDFRVERNFEGVGRRVLLLNGRRLDHVQRILLAIENITERQVSEEELQRLNEELERRVVTRTEQVRQLASELISAEQTVRQRMAQTLHDNVQQLLYAAEMQLQLLREDPGKTEAMDELEQMIDQALELTRGMTVELSPPVLKGEGLTETVTWLASHMQQIYGLRVNVTVDDHPDVDNEEQRALLFQMVRELLFNVVKHADVKEAEVTLKGDEEGVLITISDHGLGFDAAHELANKNNSFGLQSIKDRLELFSGEMEIKSSPGKGTYVTLFLPHNSNSQGVAGDA